MEENSEFSDSSSVEENRVFSDSSGEVVSGQRLPRVSRNLFNLTEFVQDTKKELGQVTWPSRQQLISESIAVIAMVALSATLVYFLDDIFLKIQAVVFPS